MLISPRHFSKPDFNGFTPGCSGSGCHSFQSGILSVTAIGNLQVRVTLSGTTAKVAGELVDANGTVVAYINSTSSNPFILTAPAIGPFTVNAGFKNPSLKWGSAPIDVTLPVELVSFNAQVYKNNVNLKWVTATETNNHGFDIERAKPGSDWKNIGFKNGAGNSSSHKSYEYLDINNVPGKYLYRLKQVDIDGSFEYSPIVEVVIENPKEFELSQNYPNPFNPITRIQYQVSSNSQVNLRVYDMLGNEVAALVDEYKPAGSYDVEFSAKGGSASGGDAKNLASGIYIYKLTVSGFAETKKMILLR